MSDENTNNMAKGILGLGEERMGELLGTLMGNESFVQAMQGAISSSLAAKRAVDKNMERVFSFWNIPTLEDLDQVKDKVEELEDIMKLVQDRLMDLDERLEDKARAEKKAAKAKKTAKKATAKKAPAKKKSTKKSAAKKDD